VEPRDSDRVGVRELRQNLSVYLRRVKEGEALDVTEHGRTVARLVPARARGSVLDRLIAEGKAKPATRDPRELKVPPGPITDVVSRALQELREDRI
jgi:prevent-host-death family protein